MRNRRSVEEFKLKQFPVITFLNACTEIFAVKVNPLLKIFRSCFWCKEILIPVTLKIWYFFSGILREEKII